MNLIAPDVITLVDTVTMAACAEIVPFGVSTISPRRVSIEVAGVDSLTAIPSASEAMQFAETLTAEHVGVALG